MTDKNDLRDMTRSFLEEIFQGAVEEEDANDSLLVEGPHGSYGHAMAGGKDQYSNYRQQHEEMPMLQSMVLNPPGEKG